MADLAEPALQYQDHFVDWIRANTSRFTGHEPVITRTPERINLGFPNLNPDVHIEIGPFSFRAYVTLHGQWFENVTDRMIVPGRREGCYVCKLNEPEEQKVARYTAEGYFQTYPNLAALRDSMLYRYLLDWCLEDLFQGRYVHLQHISYRVRAATLHSGVMPVATTAMDRYLPVWIQRPPPGHNLS